MRPNRNNQLTPLLLLSAALLLRAVIPAGYMPANAGSGLLFEFCPEGVPAEFMRIVGGNSNHHHSHAHHGESVGDDHHCPVGHLLLSAAAVDDNWQMDARITASIPVAVFSDSYESASRTHYRSRGPPA
jgi:hypothetical protein